MQRYYDSNMKLVGYVSAESAGQRTAYDSDFRPLGYYYPESNKTYDKNMRLIGKGDLLANLFGSVSAETL